MSFLMTATPLSMHVMENMSLKETGMVLQFHVVAMFLPSLITGNLIKKFGHSAIIYGGVLFFFITVLLSLFEQTYLNYMISLIFLGLGWNFLFISGTSLVVLTYKKEEKFKVQGINDLIVFSTMALASLSAGILLNSIGWKMMNLICIPFLVLIFFVVIWPIKNQFLKHVFSFFRFFDGLNINFCNRTSKCFCNRARTKETIYIFSLLSLCII